MNAESRGHVQHVGWAELYRPQAQEEPEGSELSKAPYGSKRVERDK